MCRPPNQQLASIGSDGLRSVVRKGVHKGRRVETAAFDTAQPHTQGRGGGPVSLS